MVGIGKLGVVVFGVRDQPLGLVAHPLAHFLNRSLVASFPIIIGGTPLLWQNPYPGIKAVESIFASVSKNYRRLLVAPDGHCATVKA